MFMQPDTQTGTINPAFAGYAARYIRDASDDLQRVFDNLLEIAGGDVPDATGYDRIRATRILYDRGFGKVNKNTPKLRRRLRSRPNPRYRRNLRSQRNPIVKRITVQTTPNLSKAEPRRWI